MWLSNRKIKEIVNSHVKGTNVGKISAKVVLKNGKTFNVVETGYSRGDFYVKIDIDMFFARREIKGYFKVDKDTWVPRETIEAINVTYLDYEV